MVGPVLGRHTLGDESIGAPGADTRERSVVVHFGEELVAVVEEIGAPMLGRLLPGAQAIGAVARLHLHFGRIGSALVEHPGQVVVHVVAIGARVRPIGVGGDKGSAVALVVVGVVQARVAKRRGDALREDLIFGVSGQALRPGLAGIASTAAGAVIGAVEAEGLAAARPARASLPAQAVVAIVRIQSRAVAALPAAQEGSFSREVARAVVKEGTRTRATESRAARAVGIGKQRGLPQGVVCPVAAPAVGAALA